MYPTWLFNLVKFDFCLIISGHCTCVYIWPFVNRLLKTSQGSLTWQSDRSIKKHLILKIAWKCFLSCQRWKIVHKCNGRLFQNDGPMQNTVSSIVDVWQKPLHLAFISSNYTDLSTLHDLILSRLSDILFLKEIYQSYLDFLQHFFCLISWEPSSLHLPLHWTLQVKQQTPRKFTTSKSTIHFIYHFGDKCQVTMEC